MQLKAKGDDSVTVELSFSELAVLTQALNNVCNGTPWGESAFHARMGVTREEARAILEDVWAIKTWEISK
jgi:hypothetical protein